MSVHRVSQVFRYAGISSLTIRAGIPCPGRPVIRKEPWPARSSTFSSSVSWLIKVSTSNGAEADMVIVKMIKNGYCRMSDRKEQFVNVDTPQRLNAVCRFNRRQLGPASWLRAVVRKRCDLLARRSALDVQIGQGSENHDN